MTKVFVAIAAVAITALGFAGAVWGVSWFMHSPLVWRTLSSGWVQAISDSLIYLVPIGVSVYAAIVVRGRTPEGARRNSLIQASAWLGDLRGQWFQ